MNTQSKKFAVDIGGKKFFSRSRWEANYALYLEHLKSKSYIADWSHEPETFWFEKIKRGVRSYLPDFKVTLSDGSIEYHEVKGFMDDKSLTKIRRMKIYHPKIKLVLIDPIAYGVIERHNGRLIPGWIS